MKQDDIDPHMLALIFNDSDHAQARALAREMAETLEDEENGGTVLMALGDVVASVLDGANNAKPEHMTDKPLITETFFQLVRELLKAHVDRRETRQ